ncbi:hypothetical protein TRFO_03823 [Tritrichomonas foetus]|uniref:Signal recognition particle subunit SRP68 n=1 Tax=Tritrichomonas foetus TaxID=1144522 RepID=A0A1J4KPJ7_9EUKA|nr:hypothetical protein TRFO_03823 [Tritrichomonas foetus]|eukprot:OHT11630.1 hypothetical protein TRFO_03823 [Tritrichomonas foetus]
MSGTEKVHVDVTLLLRGKQRIYGVKNNEFERYAQYCSRRVVRLTKLMKKKEDVVDMKGPKFNFSASVNQNSEHLQILLFKADGAWARYRFLKNTAEKQKRRSHAIQRLRKCQKWWQIAHDCAEAFCSERTILEVNAFQSYAKASLELERGEWSQALSTFTTVTDIFSDIREASPDATLRTFCGEIIDDINPLIEFCRFNLDKTDGTHIDAATREKIKNIYDQNTESLNTHTLSELTWRNKTVPIVHEGLRGKMANIVDLISDIHQHQAGSEDQVEMKLFDKLIMESHAARQTIRSIASKGESEELKVLDSYLDWNSYIVTLERSRVLLNTLSNANQKADLASRTYARILENKTKYDGDAAVEALMNIWRALKLLYITESNLINQQNNNASKNNSKSVALLERAKNYINTAQNIISAEGVVDPPILKTWASDVALQIRRQRIMKVAQTTGVEIFAKSGSSLSFLEDQDSYQSCQTLVQVPPLPKPIVPKGMIFNSARDEYLDYPNIDTKLSKKSWSARLKFW